LIHSVCHQFTPSSIDEPMHKQTDVITQQFGRGKEHNVVNIVC